MTDDSLFSLERRESSNCHSLITNLAHTKSNLQLNLNHFFSEEGKVFGRTIMPPVLPALLESHLQLSKDGTALNAVMHCPLLVSFNLYRMMPLHSYQRPRQSPFKSKEPTYPQASVWCRGLCDCPGWTNLFPPCLDPLPQINLSS